MISVHSHTADLMLNGARRNLAGESVWKLLVTDILGVNPPEILVTKFLKRTKAQIIMEVAELFIGQ